MQEARKDNIPARPLINDMPVCKSTEWFGAPSVFRGPAARSLSFPEEVPAASGKTSIFQDFFFYLKIFRLKNQATENCSSLLKMVFPLLHWQMNSRSRKLNSLGTLNPHLFHKDNYFPIARLFHTKVSQSVASINEFFHLRRHLSAPLPEPFLFSLHSQLSCSYFPIYLFFLFFLLLLTWRQFPVTI